MSVLKEPVETSWQQYQPLPPQIDRRAILSVPSAELDKWYRTFGAEALSRRMQEAK